MNRNRAHPWNFDRLQHRDLRFSVPRLCQGVRVSGCITPSRPICKRECRGRGGRRESGVPSGSFYCPERVRVLNSASSSYSLYGLCIPSRPYVPSHVSIFLHLTSGFCSAELFYSKKKRAKWNKERNFICHTIGNEVGIVNPTVNGRFLLLQITP